VVVLCDLSRRDLSALGRTRHFRGERGGHGEGSQRHGARGGELELAVPPGTVVTGLDGTSSELLAEGQRVVVARGGSGGHGNKRFANSTRQAPRFAEQGLKGESGWIELQLKLLADAGLVGLPNAGKSSLLARLTRAAPKVANYPFTTLEPALGTLDLDDRQVVIADIPGLIEGAAQGAGLGHEFLAHVERCRLLIHLVEVEPAEGDPASNHESVRRELCSYGGGLDALPELLVLSKVDLMPSDRAEELVGEWRARMGDSAVGVLAISSATGVGLDELRRQILGALPPDVAPAAASAAGEFETEHRVYRPGEEEGFEVAPKGKGRWRVSGRGIEMLVERFDLGNHEALDYLEARLREIGVVAELERAGFERGDEVVIGETEFDFDPA
jgi:GTP-binding protein